jgi:hypothetical protein
MSIVATVGSQICFHLSTSTVALETFLSFTEQPTCVTADIIFGAEEINKQFHQASPYFSSVFI